MRCWRSETQKREPECCDTETDYDRFRLGGGHGGAPVAPFPTKNSIRLRNLAGSCFSRLRFSGVCAISRCGSPAAPWGDYPGPEAPPPNFFDCRELSATRTRWKLPVQNETMRRFVALLELGLGSDSSAPILLIYWAQTGPGPCTK